MPVPIILVEPNLAQAPQPAAPAAESPPGNLWMGVSGVLLVATLGVGIFAKVKLDSMGKKLRMEEFKYREAYKKYKKAIATITKMERNPDLIHSREFNLDYLRMRMEEETFHFAIVNQIRMKVKQQISIALRPSQENRGAGRLVDEMFDIEYDTGKQQGGKMEKRVLFRIQIKLTKLPTQPTSQTIGQIIDCMETYLSPAGDDDTWQPAIQGRVAYIHWDQKAKPTPLLVLEQTNEGVNVTFRTNRRPQTNEPIVDEPPTRTGTRTGTGTGMRTSSRTTSKSSKSAKASKSKSRSRTR